MKCVVEFNLRCEAAIQNTCHFLPGYLDQTNAAEVVIPLWDQDDGLPGALFRDANFWERRPESV